MFWLNAQFIKNLSTLAPSWILQNLRSSTFKFWNLFSLETPLKTHPKTLPKRKRRKVKRKSAQMKLNCTDLAGNTSGTSKGKQASGGKSKATKKASSSNNNCNANASLASSSNHNLSSLVTGSSSRAGPNKMYPNSRHSVSRSVVIFMRFLWERERETIESIRSDWIALNPFFQRGRIEILRCLSCWSNLCCLLWGFDMNNMALLCLFSGMHDVRTQASIRSAIHSQTIAKSSSSSSWWCLQHGQLLDYPNPNTRDIAEEELCDAACSLDVLGLVCVWLSHFNHFAPKTEKITLPHTRTPFIKEGESEWEEGGRQAFKDLHQARSISKQPNQNSLGFGLSECFILGYDDDSLTTMRIVGRRGSWEGRKTNNLFFSSSSSTTKTCLKSRRWTCQSLVWWEEEAAGRWHEGM